MSRNLIAAVVLVAACVAPKSTISAAVSAPGVGKPIARVGGKVAPAAAAKATPADKLAGHVFDLQITGAAPDAPKPKLTFSATEISSPYLADQYGVQRIAYTAKAGKGGVVTFEAIIADDKGNTLTITATLKGHDLSAGSFVLKPKTGDSKTGAFTGRDAAFPLK